MILGLISLAIVGGLLLTLISSLNYHLGVAERQIVVTNLTNLQRRKIYEMEKNPSTSREISRIVFQLPL